MYLIQRNTHVSKLNLEDNGLEGEGGLYIIDMLKENVVMSDVVRSEIQSSINNFLRFK